MQAISLYDTLSVTTGAEATAIRCTWPDLPQENTLTKVLRLVGELVDIPPLDIYLEKRVPAESGLGAGSSDAAALLRALQHVLIAPLPEHVLWDIATAVGMDVPFFLIGGRARAEGYGETILPVEDTPRTWMVVVKPPAGCSTASAYAALDDKLYEWRGFPQGGESLLYNDFERVAPCECLELIELVQVYGASQAALSGSGSAVFGIFPNEREAKAAEGLLKAGAYPQCWTVHTLTRAESLRMDLV